MTLWTKEKHFMKKLDGAVVINWDSYRRAKRNRLRTAARLINKWRN